MPDTAAGTCRRKQRNVAVATSSKEAWRVHSLPARTMLGLSRIPLDTLLEEGMEHRSVRSCATVHEHFRLDDRHEGGVPRQRVRICAHAGGTR